MRDDDARRPGVQRAIQKRLVVLGDADYDQRLPLGVVLGGMDGAVGGLPGTREEGESVPDPLLRYTGPADLLVQLLPVEQAVLGVHPDEVGLRGGEDLATGLLR